MLHVETFTFNPIQQNTSVIHADNGDCIIVDPGCFNTQEEEVLAAFIEQKELNPIRLINTHCHIDHVLGNCFVNERYGLLVEAHEKEQIILDSAPAASLLYQIPYKPYDHPLVHIDLEETIRLGDSDLQLLFVPGHCPGHIALYAKEENFVVSGDVLFLESIGRTDLPGGDLNTLINSIREVMWHLPDTCQVFPGHGPTTSIGHEKAHNPFLQ